MDMITLYRRHLKDCQHRAKGRAYRRCKCPVWMDGTVQGERIHVAMHTTSWEKASEDVAKIEKAGRIEKTLAVQKACEEFIADCESRRLSRSTLRTYRVVLTSDKCLSLSKFAEAEGVEMVSGITFDFLSRLRTAWQCEASTQGMKLQKLRCFCDWLVKRDYLPDNPATDVKAPKVRAEPTLPFTREEMVRLLAATPDDRTGEEAARLHALILTGRYTGLRRKDIVTLPFGAVTDGRLVLHTAKTRVQVFLVLPPVLVDVLKRLPRASERYYFWSGVGDPETAASNYARAFRRLGKAAGVKRAHLHRLRDTFAVELLLAATPIEDVARLLGHSSTAMTQKHYSPWVKELQVRLEDRLAMVWAMDESLRVGDTANQGVN